MGQLKTFYHEEIMYNYYKNLYEGSEMPLWVMEQYGFPMNTPPVIQEEEHLTDDDMKDAIEAIDIELENYKEEYARLAKGERMLFNVTFDNDGTAYPEYITKS
jgi:hypothetical protein